MKEALISKHILSLFGASAYLETEIIQTLWSDYGKICRWDLIGSSVKTIVVKHIHFPKQSNHPRGWNTNASHSRKVKSYEVEQAWYEQWSSSCNIDCRIPLHYETITDGEERLILLEDLDAAGYSIRKTSLNKEGAKLGLSWLANFHATFMNETPTNLWKEGSYWHLDTRKDELEAMIESPLKEMAHQIDELLSASQFQTIIHGDAKVANFCFSEDMQTMAAVDFQYVGGGCGMKDVVYFLGSCLNEEECESFETELLDSYFKVLKLALIKNQKQHHFSELEKEWRSLYSIAWTDFTRFLLGWMPSHQKLNDYSKKLKQKTFSILENKKLIRPS